MSLQFHWKFISSLVLWPISFFYWFHWYNSIATRFIKVFFTKKYRVNAILENAHAGWKTNSTIGFEMKNTIMLKCCFTNNFGIQLPTQKRLQKSKRHENRKLGIKVTFINEHNLQSTGRVPNDINSFLTPVYQI